MPKLKLKLTLEQSEMIKNHVLIEMVKDTNQLNEGAWENIKYALSKLGRYKAGGKILNKGAVDREAIEKITNIIDRKGNEIIKNLDSKIKSTNPEFPNNKRSVDFLSTIMEISTIYDTLVAATKKQPNEDGYLPIDAANIIINDLKEYVKKFLDVDLKAAYSVVDENELEITEGELTELDNLYEDLSSTVRQHLQNKRGGGDDFKSDRMSTLKSNKLPLTLMGVGASLGAFGWLVNTDWFKSFFETMTPDSVTDTITQKTEIFNDIKDGEGVYKLLSRVTNHQVDGYSSPSEFIDVLKQVGGGDASKGVDLLCQEGGVMMHPKEAAQGLHDLVNNPDKYKNMGQLFQAGTETSGTGQLTPTNTTLYGTIAGKQLATILIKTIPGILVKGGIKVGAGYAAAKGLANVLGPIGIGLLGAGALVKIMRMKGAKQSRAKTLNDLYQSLRSIEGGSGMLQQTGDIGNDVSRGTSNIDNSNLGNSDSDSTNQLYNQLKKLFQTIVNNKNKLGIRGGQNYGTGAAMRNSRMKTGDTYSYNGKSVKILNPNIGDGRTQVQSLDKAKNVFTVKTDTLQKLQENSLMEGQFITDKRLVQFLQKNLSVDKLKSFEDLISRVEAIRGQIKRLKGSNDKVLKGFLDKFNKNPIMATDFRKMFNVSSENPQAVNSLKAFIDDVYITIYSGKYKYSSIIDKMSGLGGNVNKLEESEDVNYSALSPNKSFIKDAQDRRMFKKNLLSFIENSVSLFQYLYKIKTQGPTKPKIKPKQGQNGQEPTEQSSQPNVSINELKGVSNTLLENTTKIKDILRGNI